MVSETPGWRSEAGMGWTPLRVVVEEEVRRWAS